MVFFYPTYKVLGYYFFSPVVRKIMEKHGGFFTLLTIKRVSLKALQFRAVSQVL